MESWEAGQGQCQFTVGPARLTRRLDLISEAGDLLIPDKGSWVLNLKSVLLSRRVQRTEGRCEAWL